MRITFIGGGNMAGAILAGLHARYGNEMQLHVVDRNADKGERFARDYGASHSLALTDSDLDADVLVLAVKPQQLKELAAQIAPQLREQLVISVAAGVRTSKLASWLGGYQKLVWVMPNTPAQVGAGVSGLYATAAVSASERDTAARLFEAVGQVVWLDDEDRMDNLTAISGCGPAYVFLMVEALTAAAQAQGFDAASARSMAEGTFFGAVKLLQQSGEDAATLRAKVTSKKGVTEQGILSMQADDLAGVIARGVEKARLRSIELGELL
ncbi:pyrroline-5-carboxylate reductase [Chitinimonas sp.]|uniref:pyrroline-5-carboxylate reductase n=1 Tax=Chitinimonas sp. TaxID=1934313 RepID=UPI0035B19CD3